MIDCNVLSPKYPNTFNVKQKKKNLHQYLMCDEQIYGFASNVKIYHDDGWLGGHDFVPAHHWMIF